MRATIKTRPRLFVCYWWSSEDRSACCEIMFLTAIVGLIIWVLVNHGSCIDVIHLTSLQQLACIVVLLCSDSHAMPHSTCAFHFVSYVCHFQRLSLSQAYSALFGDFVLTANGRIMVDIVIVVQKLFEYDALERILSCRIKLVRNTDSE